MWVEFIEDIDNLLALDILRLGLWWRERSCPDPQYCLGNTVVVVPLDDLMRRSVVLLSELHVLNVDHLDCVLPHQTKLTHLFAHRVTKRVILCSSRIVWNSSLTSIEGKLLRILILQSITQVPSSRMLKLRYFDEDILGNSNLISIYFDCMLALMPRDLFFLSLLKWLVQLHGPSA